MKNGSGISVPNLHLPSKSSSKGREKIVRKFWTRAGPVGLIWGTAQGTVILIANLEGLLPPPQGSSVYLGVLPILPLLGLFATGAMIGLLMDNADVTMRAFVLSQLIGALLGWGIFPVAQLVGAISGWAPLLTVSPRNFGDLGLGIVFVMGFMILSFFLSAVGGLAGGFLIGIYEGAIRRSLDWRILVLSLGVALVPVCVVSASPNIGDESHFAIAGGGIAIPGMIASIVGSSATALYGFFRGGRAAPRAFCLLILVAGLTGILSLFTFDFAYRLYNSCVKPFESPCALAIDLANLAIVTGSSLVPFGIVLLGCLFAKDERALSLAAKTA